MVSERRIAQRFTAVNTAECRPYDAFDADHPELSLIQGRTLNLSATGALLETRTQIAPNQRLNVMIGLAEACVQLEALSVHGRRRTDGRFITGICFLDPDRQARLLIHRYLREC